MNLLDKITGYFSVDTGSFAGATIQELKDFIGGADSYSLVETATGGTWIDGKPIFRKVVQFTGGNASSSSPPDTDLEVGVGLEFAIRGLIVVDLGPGVRWSFGTNSLAVTGTPSNFTLFDDGDINLNHFGQDFTGAPITVIIDYTKP